MLGSALRTPRGRGARGAVDAAVPTAGVLGWIRGRSSQLSSSSTLGITLAQVRVCVCVCVLVCRSCARLSPRVPAAPQMPTSSSR